MRRARHPERTAATAGLPGVCQGDFLYAYEFSDGTIKVGVTGKPRARAAQLALRFKLRITRVHVARTVSVRYLAEREALRMVSKIGTASRGCTERFHGLHFGEAVNAINQAARRVYVRQCA